MQIITNLLKPSLKAAFKKQIENVIAMKIGKSDLYEIALSHRSIKDSNNANNERLEFLGDAVLSSIVADYLFKRYPIKGEGFLTEMRSKMVNRQQLNDIAIKMGIKHLMLYNKSDVTLKNSQIFGNTLEAIIGAIYLDKGYAKTQVWIIKQIIMPHMYVESLEAIDINLKNKLIGWANKQNKQLIFDVADERKEGARKLFTINVLIDTEIIATGIAFSKKDASLIATQNAIATLNL